MHTFGIFLISILFECVIGSERIFNGYPIDIEQAPYMAFIYILVGNGNFIYCGGSIVHANFILTAGHCVAKKQDVENPPVRSPDSFTVRVGSAMSYSGGEIYKVSTVYSKIWSYHNDIGMLKLSRSISFDGKTMKAIKMPSSSDYYPAPDTNAYIQGWGKNPSAPNTDQMYRADVSTISAMECSDEYEGSGLKINSSKQLCTLGSNDAGPCSGDSGSPLVLADSTQMQIGIDSLGPGDCENPDGYPTIFTSVAGNLDWIRGVMNGNIGGNNYKSYDDQNDVSAVPNNCLVNFLGQC